LIDFTRFFLTHRWIAAYRIASSLTEGATYFACG
jgi:hypothetical protein